MNPTIAQFIPQGWEFVAIIFVVLLLFGAKKIPELARGLGRSVGEFKKAKGEFDREVQESMKTEVETDRPREIAQDDASEPVDVKPEPASQTEPRAKA
ncbi:MAG: twin-arginine translocase TatA/TatE family subunit [Verrucomicrobiota bacterium]